MSTSWAAVCLTFSALLFAATVEANSIVASHEGCTSEAVDFSWIGEDFLFMAFHSPEQGCAPTIENPTRGIFIESTTLDGGFRVDVPAWLLRGGCGRYQFDAHVRVPGGLSLAPGGLQTLVFDTGIDCELTVNSSQLTIQFESVVPVHDWPITDTPQTPPIYRQVPPDVPISLPVPDGSSTLALLAVALMALVRLR